MSQQYIPLYNDDVVKISIKQGEESDRFNSSGATISSTVYSLTSTLPGAFTTGELAYTRDTNRVFVGNFTNESKFLYDSTGKQIIQQTAGGTLVGNKYLGYIDSKPPLNFTLNNDNRNAIPLSLTETNTITNYEGTKITIPGLLTPESSFRSYEFTESGTTCKKTEDGLWSRQSYYNAKYDAYDGDLMYDRYRNALILFDHNIKPSYTGDITVQNNNWNINWVAGEPNAKNISTERKRTPLIPWVGDRNQNDTTSSSNCVYNFSKDIYGDGYALFYNVIPDGDTITFIPRNFNSVTGESNDKPNFSHNVFTLKNVYAENLRSALNENYFKFGTTIELQPTIQLSEITSALNGSLTIPDDIIIKSRYRFSFQQFEDINPSSTYYLQFTPTSGNDGEPQRFIAKLVSGAPASMSTLSSVSPLSLLSASENTSNNTSYRIELGDGLTTQDGKNYFILDNTHTKGSIIIRNSLSANTQIANYNTALDNSLNGASSLVSNPYNINISNLSTYYSGNHILNASGQIIDENGFEKSYADAAEKYTNQFDNINTKINYLNSVIPIANISGDIDDINLKFRINPVVYCSTPSISTNIKAIGPISANDIISINNRYDFNSSLLKSIWVTGYNAMKTPPPDYTKMVLPKICAKTKHDTNITSLDTGSYTSGLYTLKIERATGEITVSTDSDGKFNISGSGITTLSSLDSLGISSLGRIFSTISDISDIFDYTSISSSSITFTNYFTNFNIHREKYLMLEACKDNMIYIIEVPIKFYLYKLIKTDNIINVENENINNINSINYYPINSTSSSPLSVSFSYNDNTTGFIFLVSDENIPHGIIEFTQNDGNIITKYPGNNLDVAKESSSGTSVSSLTNPYTWTKETTASSYTALNTKYGTFNNISTSLNYTEYIISSYYISSEIDISDIFDSWALYYTDESQTTLLTHVSNAGGKEAWKQKLKLMFPVIPKHATSVFLRCKTENTPLTLNCIGNNKSYIYDGQNTSTNANITGLNLPFDILPKTSWLTNKNIVVPANSDTIVEIPISVDSANNKHFTLSVSGGASTTIYIAGYRA